MLQRGEVARREVAATAVLKNLAHPLIAGAMAFAWFHMTGHQLATAMVLGALPTAQNVYTYALRYRINESLARDAGVVTTAMSFPVLVLISTLF